jgi:hypothetical protein
VDCRRHHTSQITDNRWHLYENIDSDLSFYSHLPLSIFIIIVFISVGILQVIWSVLIVRQQRKVLCYWGLIGSTLLTISGLTMIVFVDNFSRDVCIYCNNNKFQSYDIKFMAISTIILLPQFAYMIISTIITIKEKQLKAVETNKMSTTKLLLDLYGIKQKTINSKSKLMLTLHSRKRQ